PRSLRIVSAAKTNLAARSRDRESFPFFTIISVEVLAKSWQRQNRTRLNGGRYCDQARYEISRSAYSCCARIVDSGCRPSTDPIHARGTSWTDRSKPIRRSSSARSLRLILLK